MNVTIRLSKLILNGKNITYLTRNEVFNGYPTFLL